MLFAPVPGSALYEEYRDYLDEIDFGLRHLNGTPSTGSGQGRSGSWNSTDGRPIQARFRVPLRALRILVTKGHHEFRGSTFTPTGCWLVIIALGNVTSYSDSVSLLIFDVVHHFLQGESICSLHQE
jgi:hypothetical protein